MADYIQIVDAGGVARNVAAVDKGADGFVQQYEWPSSAGTDTVQVNAAAVVAAAWSVIDATATGGKRFAKVIVACNKAHTIEFYGDSADFAAITTAHHIISSKRTGCAENSATGGDTYYVPCGGHSFFGARVQNNDGAASATVTVSVLFFDA